MLDQLFVLNGVVIMSSSGHNDYVANLKMAISELFNSEKSSKYYYKFDDN